MLITGLTSGSAPAQSLSDSQLIPLCELQTQLAQGERRNVQVEGVYLSGIEGQYLVTSGCSGRSTFIEFELRTHRLWTELVRLSNRTNMKKHVSGDGDPVLVVFEGEFCGPRVPDPKLPEAIRKNYHVGWDPMNTSMTKMVVRAILRVQPLPANHPCAPPESNPRQWPCFQNPASQSGGAALGGSVGVPADSLAHESGHARTIDIAIGQLAYDLLKQYARSDGLRTFDSLIAATAIRWGFELVSRNRKHFAMIDGLQLESPRY